MNGMKKIVLLLMVMFPLLALSQSKQSDEYFKKGVELYNKGKFKEAIPFFEKSQALDLKELDEDNNRRFCCRLSRKKIDLHSFS